MNSNNGANNMNSNNGANNMNSNNGANNNGANNMNSNNGANNMNSNNGANNNGANNNGANNNGANNNMNSNNGANNNSANNNMNSNNGANNMNNNGTNNGANNNGANNMNNNGTNNGANNNGANNNFDNEIDCINENDIQETFKNIGYIKMKQLSNQIESNPLFTQNFPDTLSATPTIKYDIDLENFKKRKELLKNKFNLNSNNSKIIINNLLTNELFIPDYKCCTDTIGSIQKFNLYNLKNIILQNRTYYQLEDHNNNIYYICPPMKFPENIGLDIREKLVDDINIRYLKEKK